MSTANIPPRRVRIENAGSAPVTLRNVRLDIPQGEPASLVDTITISAGDTITATIHPSSGLILTEALEDSVRIKEDNDD